MRDILVIDAMADPLTIIHGDALSSLRTLDSESVQCVVTSPPYWGLRDYGVDGQLGLEKTPEEYVSRLVEIFRDVKRVLRGDGTLWLNLGDSYFGDSPARKASSESFSKEWNPADSAGNGGNRRSAARSGDLKPKDLVGIPWLVAFALRADGWYLRSDIIWSKPNPMPESVTDRPTKSHEYIFLLSKSDRYHYDQDAIREPVDIEYLRSRWGGSLKRTGQNGQDTIERSLATGRAETCGVNLSGRNKRSVWTVTTRPYKEAHFATFPPELITPCILAGAPLGGVVLDPFAGSGTTGKAAIEIGRQSILIEPKAEYVEMIKRRCQTTIGLPLAI